MGKSLYTQELADAICERLEAGDSLRKACEGAGGPDPSTVLRWTQDAACIGFAQQYAQAREAGYRLLADQIIEISDDSSNDVIDTEHGPKANPEVVARSRLRVDSRKWMLSKMLPKLYGDRLELAGTLKIGAVDMTDAELMAIAAGARNAGNA